MLSNKLFAGVLVTVACGITCAQEIKLSGYNFARLMNSSETEQMVATAYLAGAISATQGTMHCGRSSLDEKIKVAGALLIVRPNGEEVSKRAITVLKGLYPCE